jgi:hypothetical protein
MTILFHNLLEMAKKKEKVISRENEKKGNIGKKKRKR